MAIMCIVFSSAVTAGGGFPSMIDSTTKEFLIAVPLGTPKTALIDYYGVPTLTADTSTTEKLTYYDLLGSTKTYTFVLADQKLWDVKIDDSVWWRDRGSARKYQDRPDVRPERQKVTKAGAPAWGLPRISLQLGIAFLLSIIVIIVAIAKAVEKDKSIG